MSIWAFIKMESKGPDVLCACAWWSESAYFAHVRRHSFFFLSDTAHIINGCYCIISIRETDTIPRELTLDTEIFAPHPLLSRVILKEFVNSFLSSAHFWKVSNNWEATTCPLKFSVANWQQNPSFVLIHLAYYKPQTKIRGCLSRGGAGRGGGGGFRSS